MFAAQDDSLCISGSDDRTIKLWDMKTRDARPVQSWDEAKDGVSCLAVHDNGNGNEHEVVAGSTDGRVRTYDIRAGKLTTDVFPASVTSVCLSHDGKTMLVGCLDGKLRVMDRADGTCLRVLPPETQQSTFPHPTNRETGGGYTNKSLRLKSTLAQTSSLVLSGSESDGTVRAWDILDNKVVDEIQVNPSGKVVSVVVWREGNASGGKGGVWAAGGGEGIVRVFGQ